MRTLLALMLFAVMLLAALTPMGSICWAQIGRSFTEAMPLDSEENAAMHSVASLLLKSSSYGPSAEQYIRRKLRSAKQADTALLRREFYGMLDTNYPRVLAYAELRSRMDSAEIRTAIKFLQSAAGSKLRNVLSPTKFETEYWDDYLQKTYALAATKVKTAPPRLAAADTIARPLRIDSTAKQLIVVRPVRKDFLMLVGAKVVLQKPDSLNAIISVQPAARKQESMPAIVQKATPSTSAKAPLKLPPTIKSPGAKKPFDATALKQEAKPKLKQEGKPKLKQEGKPKTKQAAKPKAMPKEKAVAKPRGLPKSKGD